MENKKLLYADLSLLIVAIIWGSGFVVTKNALDNMTPYYILGFRFIISTVLLGLISYKKLKTISKKELKAGILIGLFLFFGFATQTVGLKYTTAGKQGFITATNVVMVPFMYWALTKKKPDAFEFFGAILCFIGIGILSSETNLTIGYGEFLTFLCAIGFAAHIVSVGYFAKDVDPFVISVIQLGTAAVLSFVFAFLFEPRIAKISTSSIFPILYLGVFGTMVAFLIQNIAQNHTTSTHAAIILSLEAVFGSIFALIFLKEQFTLRFLIGCIAIFISVLASETKFSFLRRNKGKGLI